MTDEEMAEEYVDILLDKDDAELDKLLDENLGDLKLTEKQAGTLLGIIKGVGISSFLAGLKAVKDTNVATKWHKVADGDLPKDLCLVIACFWELGKKQVREVYFDSKYFCYHGKHIEPVAWQYFPVPPKEELC